MFSVHYGDYIHEGGLGNCLTMYLYYTYYVYMSRKNNYVLLNRSWSSVVQMLVVDLNSSVCYLIEVLYTSQPSNIPWCDLNKNCLIYRHRRVGGGRLQELKRKEARITLNLLETQYLTHHAPHQVTKLTN